MVNGKLKTGGGESLVHCRLIILELLGLKEYASDHRRETRPSKTYSDWKGSSSSLLVPSVYMTLPSRTL